MTSKALVGPCLHEVSTFSGFQWTCIKNQNNYKLFFLQDDIFKDWNQFSEIHENVDTPEKVDILTAIPNSFPDEHSSSSATEFNVSPAVNETLFQKKKRFRNKNTG